MVSGRQFPLPEAGEKKKRLLLHSCCAPCSTACLEALAGYFDVAVFYYNPNITDEAEYFLRENEQKRFLALKGVPFIVGNYDSGEFYTAAKGLEKEKEGGKRCLECFRLRLFRTAEEAAKLGFDVFATTLTVSPMKNAAAVNAAGREASEKYGVEYLPTDFKKNDGYRRSTELSREFGLYRQNYCGCEFSKRQ